MYQSYMRQNFLYNNPAHESVFVPGRSMVLPHPKEWYGDPMVTLQRGFKMVGWAPDVFPNDIGDALWALSRLYGQNDKPPPVVGRSVRRPTPSEASQDHDGSDDHDQDKQPPPGPRTPRSNAYRRDSHPNGAKQNPSGSSSNRRQSGRIQDQRNRQELQKRQREQDEARRLLQDPPNKRLRREIREGIWKWGPLTSSHDAAVAYMRRKNQQKGAREAMEETKRPSRLQQGLLSPKTSRRS